jgi:hypothetical protein
VVEAPIIKTYRSGATGLINSLCNEIGLVEHECDPSADPLSVNYFKDSNILYCFSICSTMASLMMMQA